MSRSLSPEAPSTTHASRSPDGSSAITHSGRNAQTNMHSDKIYAKQTKPSIKNLEHRWQTTGQRSSDSPARWEGAVTVHFLRRSPHKISSQSPVPFNLHNIARKLGKPRSEDSQSHTHPHTKITARKSLQMCGDTHTYTHKHSQQRRDWS